MNIITFSRYLHGVISVWVVHLLNLGHVIRVEPLYHHIILFVSISLFNCIYFPENVSCGLVHANWLIRLILNMSVSFFNCIYFTEDVRSGFVYANRTLSIWMLTLNKHRFGSNIRSGVLLRCRCIISILSCIRLNVIWILISCLLLPG